MDDAAIFLWAIALGISLLIYYAIIRAAAGTKKREKQLKIMNAILLHMAQKQGIDPEALKQLEQMNNEM